MKKNLRKVLKITNYCHLSIIILIYELRIAWFHFEFRSKCAHWNWKWTLILEFVHITNMHICDLYTYKEHFTGVFSFEIICAFQNRQKFLSSKLIHILLIDLAMEKSKYKENEMRWNYFSKEKKEWIFFYKLLLNRQIWFGNFSCLVSIYILIVFF